MPKRRNGYKGDVEFYPPVKNRKKPIAYTTKATSDFLVLVASFYPGANVTELRDRLMDKTQWILNPDAVQVCDAYIEKGYGDYVPEWR